MTMWKAILASSSLFGCGVQAGALLMFLYGVCPTLQRAEVPDWMRLHVSLDRSIERYMPLLNLKTGATSIALLFFTQPAEVRWLRVTGLAANIALAVLSEAANVPLNKRIARRLPVLAGAGGQDEPRAEDLAATAAIRDRW